MGDEASIDAQLFVSSLSEGTYEEVMRHPSEVGAALQSRNILDLAVMEAIHENPNRAVGAVMDALVMEGVVQWAPVRFPRIHRALGRMVIGDTRYYTPNKPPRD